MVNDYNASKLFQRKLNQTQVFFYTPGINSDSIFQQQLEYTEIENKEFILEKARSEEKTCRHQEKRPKYDP